MSDHSEIEWTDATWNPTTGCTKVSPACANCYIERTPPFRIKGRKFVNGHIPLELHEDRLDQPRLWRQPRRVFVNSLSDLFHDDVPDHFIFRVYQQMAGYNQHIYQVLTKRPDRMASLVGDWLLAWPGKLDHVWHGVSVENQAMAHRRIPALLSIHSKVKFLSCEPLLGRIELSDPSITDRLGGWISYLDWIIVGGESGPRLRPTNPDWVRSLRDQCVEAGVAFFFKQWGGLTPKSGGRTLDGRTWDEMPQTIAAVDPHVSK